MRGQLLRGDVPTPFNRILSTCFGVGAAELALAGVHGGMVVIQGGTIVEVPLERVGGRTRTVPSDLP